MPDVSLAPSRPVMDARDFSVDLFRTLFERHGCVLVRNMISPERIKILRDIAQLTYQHYDALMEGHRQGREPTPEMSIYFRPTPLTENAKFYDRFRRYGSLMLAEMIMAAAMVAPTLAQSPVLPAIQDWLGTEPFLGLNASSVRKSELGSSVRRVFHQDGNFLGGLEGATVNCWIAADHCGVDAPALEVYPWRIQDLMPCGGEGAAVAWEIPEQDVYDRFGRENMWIPEFAPGDAMVFDHVHVHRTHKTDSMTKERYAFENWMFPATSANADKLLMAI